MTLLGHIAPALAISGEEHARRTMCKGRCRPARHRWRPSFRLRELPCARRQAAAAFLRARRHAARTRHPFLSGRGAGALAVQRAGPHHRCPLISEPEHRSTAGWPSPSSPRASALHRRSPHRPALDRHRRSSGKRAWRLRPAPLRSNIVLALTAEPFAEDALSGKTLRFGDAAELKILERIPALPHGLARSRDRDPRSNHPSRPRAFP